MPTHFGFTFSQHVKQETQEASNRGTSFQTDAHIVAGIFQNCLFLFLQMWTLLCTLSMAYSLSLIKQLAPQLLYQWLFHINLSSANVDLNLTGANMLCVCVCVCGGIHIEENSSGCILAPFLHLSPTHNKYISKCKCKCK